MPTTFIVAVRYFDFGNVTFLPLTSFQFSDQDMFFILEFVTKVIYFTFSEIEINTIEDCIGESCLIKKSGKEGISGNLNPYDEDNNGNDLWKNGKKRNR